MTARLSKLLMIRSIITACLTGFIFSMVSSSCSSDNVEELFPCDTTDTVSYSTFIQPLFEGSCGATSTSCHQTGTVTSTVLLDSYDNVSAVDTARMLACMKHLPGAKPMPYNAPKLDDCIILKVEKWLHAGKPQ